MSLNSEFMSHEIYAAEDITIESHARNHYRQQLAMIFFLWLIQLFNFWFGLVVTIFYFLWTFENTSPEKPRRIRTKIKIEIPSDICCLVHAEPELAAQGMTVLNNVILSGEVVILVKNLSWDDIEIKKGSSFAKLILLPRLNTQSIKISSS